MLSRTAESSGECGLSAFCTLAFIADKSFWYDEGISLSFATLDWSTLWSAVHHADALIAAYYVILHLWMAAFGTAETTARGLSALGAIACVPFVYSATIQFIDRRTAIVASTLLASSVFFVNYADDVRPYALEMCVSAISTWALVSALHRPSKSGFFNYALAAIVAIYIHAFAMFLIAAQLISVPLLRSDWRRYVLAFGCVIAGVVVCCLPLALLQSQVGLSRLDWIASPKLSDLWKLLLDFTGSRLAALIALVCCLLALIPIDHTTKRREILSIALWTILPIAVVYILSTKHPVFLSRYLIVTFPPFIMFVAAGITSIRNNWAIAVVTLLIAVLSLRDIWVERNRSGEDFRAAASYTQRHAGSSDGVVVFLPGAIYAFKAEVIRSRRLLRAPVLYPSANWHYWSEKESQPILPATSSLAGYEHIWLILRGDPASDKSKAIKDRILSNYVRRIEEDFSYVSVIRFDKK